MWQEEMLRIKCSRVHFIVTEKTRLERGLYLHTIIRHFNAYLKDLQ